tara:strand:- start:26 stop:724 length:699 start_codon:yes stop_codon:yes gene_type:complete
MEKIIQAISQLREDPNNNKYSDEELISIYNLGGPSFQNANTGILSNINFPQFNLPDFSNIKNLGGQITGGLLSYATGIPFLGPIISNIAQPAVSDVMGSNYMAENYGLDDIGRVQTGIMKGYNPVNLMGTGMIESIDKRLDNIRNRRMPQTDDSRQKISELEKLQSDLIANEKAQTYAPVVTPEQKQYFSGGNGGNQNNNQSSGIGSGHSGSGYQGARGSHHYRRGGLASIL